MPMETLGGYASLSRRCLAGLLFALLTSQSAVFGFGLVTRVPMHGTHMHPVSMHMRHNVGSRLKSKTSTTGKQARRASAKQSTKKSGKHAKTAKAHKEPPAPPPQDLIGKLNTKTIAPGVVYKFYRGPLNINVVDVSMSKANVQVRPLLAGTSFNRLADVKNHARQSQALAAVNANYFKKDGTPLGTLIIDKEWVAGPIYDRVSLGITNCGYVRIDRVNLYGIMSTSNPAAPSIWVNNINTPRRHGVKLVLYTRRWGDSVRLPYAGCLVAVDAQGQVVDKKTTVIGVPRGGFVLSDTKGAKISKLRMGDLVKLSWHTKPGDWADVEQAVSGGPMLIKDGELYLDLKAENFRKAWTGRQIHARTAAGVTAYNHLLLVTIEGPHTLWDFAKFLRKLGAVDAMNLDGGGSTTMVVGGTTVTKNANSYQRRVASSLAIVDARSPQYSTGSATEDYVPTSDLTSFIHPQILHPVEDFLSDLGLPESPAIDLTLPDAPGAEQTKADIVSQAPTSSNLP